MPPHATFAVTAGLLFGIAGAAYPAHSQDAKSAPPAAAVPAPIGKVESLKGEVRIEHSTAVPMQAGLTTSSQAKPSDPVFEGDLVQTGADSALGIVFTDGTAFNLSSNARMTLDRYLFEPEGKSNSTFFNLTKGTFTFVAGKIAKTGDMKIDTPVATMGIRGTAPHVEILEDGTVKFSTLVEADKNSPQKTRPGPQRRAAIQSPGPDQHGSVDVRKKPGIDKNLIICRGC